MALTEMLIAGAIMVSAFLAIYLDEAVYAILSLAVMFITLSILYLSLNATLPSVFQLAIGSGTVVAFALAGVMLTRRGRVGKTLREKALSASAFILISIVLLRDFVKVNITSHPSNITLATSLWELRWVDVLAQGLLVLVMALGMGIVLGEEDSEG